MSAKTAKSQNISLRISPEIWLRCEWAAESVGLNRCEWARNTLAAASRNAEPPKPRETLAVSPETVQGFVGVARAQGVTVEALLTGLLKRLTPSADLEGGQS